MLDKNYTLTYVSPIKTCFCGACPDNPTYYVEFDLTNKMITVYEAYDEWYFYLDDDLNIKPYIGNDFIIKIEPLYNLIQSHLKRIVFLKNFL